MIEALVNGFPATKCYENVNVFFLDELFELYLLYKTVVLKNVMILYCCI
jgi:hypothetical protein